MPKYKTYNYHQTTLVPMDLEKQLPPGSIEFAIHYLVDNEIDLTGLDSRYKNEDEGRPAYDPRILLKVVLLGDTTFSLDGLKLPSNASKQMSGTFAELRHKKKKLEEKVRKLIKRHKRTDDKENKDDDRYSRNQEKQIERLKRRAEKIDKFLKETEPKHNHRGHEIKSNITDND